MNAALTTRQEGRVLVVTMDDGKANALSTALSSSLRTVITDAENDEGIGALVIAGRPGRFSAGFDLDVMRAGNAGAVREMVSSGGALVAHAYGAAIPVVAACTGHAVAAGALLLLGCDHRVGPDAPVKIGLNEVAIGMVLPDWAMAIAADRLSHRHAQASIVNAKLFDGAGAVDAGFLDVAVAADAVIDTAVQQAAALAELDRAAYVGTVKAFRGATLARMATST